MLMYLPMAVGLAAVLLVVGPDLDSGSYIDGIYGLTAWKSYVPVPWLG